jgi:DNA polymerase elongation subunit (family B)
MSYIYLDIETLPRGEPEPPAPVPPFEVPTEEDAPKSYKSETKIAEWVQREHEKRAAKYEADCEKAWQQAHEAWAKRSLHGTFGRIICVCVAVDDGPVVGICSDDEAALLGSLDRGLAKYPRAEIVTYNGLSFDLPYLAQRAAAHRLRTLCRRVHRAKPWEKKGILDLYPLWNSGLQRQKGRLPEVAECLGIEANDDTDGNMVLELYQAGDLQAIIDHCRADVETLREVHGVMHDMGMC